MSIFYKPEEEVTTTTVNNLIAIIGTAYVFLFIGAVWLIVTTLVGNVIIAKQENIIAKQNEYIQTTDETISNLHEKISFITIEFYEEFTDLDIELSDYAHKLEVLEAQVEIIDESINGREKRNAKRKVVIAAIKSTLLQYGNPISGCPKVPSPGEIWSIAGAIIDHSEDYSVPASLIAAVIRQESIFCNKAVSPVGARGYMQLMPNTAAQVSADVAVKTGRALRTWRGRDNIQLGTAYLSEMLLEFDGNPLLAARAYNAGPSHVKKVRAGLVNEQTCKDGTVTQYHCETEHYGTKVMRFKAEYEKLGL